VIEPEYREFARCWNDGDFFMAHEVLEGLWTRTRDRGQQGLIQIAVALHHISRGNLRGAKTMIDRALPRLRSAATTEPIDLSMMARYAVDLREAIDRDRAQAALESRPRLKA